MWVALVVHGDVRRVAELGVRGEALEGVFDTPSTSQTKITDKTRNGAVLNKRNNNLFNPALRILVAAGTLVRSMLLAALESGGAAGQAGHFQIGDEGTRGERKWRSCVLQLLGRATWTEAVWKKPALRVDRAVCLHPQETWIFSLSWQAGRAHIFLCHFVMSALTMVFSRRSNGVWGRYFGYSCAHHYVRWRRHSPLRWTVAHLPSRVLRTTTTMGRQERPWLRQPIRELPLLLYQLTKVWRCSLSAPRWCCPPCPSSGLRSFVLGHVFRYVVDFLCGWLKACRLTPFFHPLQWERTQRVASYELPYPTSCIHLVEFLQIRHVEPCARPTVVLAAVEELLSDISKLVFFRVIAWWLLLQSQGTLRFADRRGLEPSNILC